MVVLVVVSGFSRLFMAKENDCDLEEPNGEVSAG